LPFVDPAFAEAMNPHRSRRAAREERKEKPDHKTMQLCCQAQRALTLALAGECDDDVLRLLYVAEVLPAPDASRLLVRVELPRGAGDVSIVHLLERLSCVQGLLRNAVARAITRKRAPELTFLPTREGEVAS
jgi:ribosome-binding factor A